MIFPRMVSAVFFPSRMAPDASVNIPIITACLRVREPEPTEVAKELATSLAPMP